MMVMSNSCETGTLKFDDAVGVLLSEEARRKLSGAAESALSVERTGRSMNREKKKNSKFKSNFERIKARSRGIGCWHCGDKGHIQRNYK